MGKDYLVNGAKLICVCGSMLSSLKVSRNKMYTSGNKEKANCKDCKACINIPCFGGCMLNTATHTCEGFMDLADRWQNTAISLKKPEKVYGEEAITMDSILICKKGGIIMPLTSGQGYGGGIDFSAFAKRFQRALLWLAGKNLLCHIFGGDPINMNTGNYIYEKEDLVIPGSTSLSFRMFYNAIDAGEIGSLGKGWHHNQEWKIQGSSGNGLIYLCTGEGRRIPYRKTAGELYTPLMGDIGLLKKESEGYRYCDRENVEYLFDGEGKLLKKVDRNGNQDEYFYDPKGQLKEIHGANGGKLFYHYNREGKLIKVKDHAGREAAIYYRYGKLYRFADSCGYSFSYLYNENGKLESIVRPDGITALKNEYDSFNRIVKQTMPDGGVTEIKYDTENQKTYHRQPNGSMIIYESDERFRNIRTIYEDGEEKYKYNDKNLRTLSVDKLGNTTKYRYDERGNLTEMIDSMGNHVKMAYDDKNHLLCKKTPEGVAVENRYDKMGRLTETKDAEGNVKSFYYDEFSRPTKIIQEDGSEISIEYDNKGNITGVTDALGNLSKYEYDDLNRVTAAWDGNGNQTKYSYDNHNDMTESINALGDQKLFGRDFNGKITSVTDYDGSVASVQYGLSNKAEVLEDKEGNKVQNTFDQMGNLTEKLFPNGSKQSYTYDMQNRVIEFRDVLGYVTKYEYDANGNRTKIIMDDGAVTSFCYDALNRISKKTEPDGAETCYEYDWQGQVTKIVHPGELTEEMSYDACGRVTEHKDVYGNRTITKYNAMGKPCSVTVGKELTTEYEYYPGGLLKRVNFPDGTWQEFKYDGNANVIKKRDQGGYILNYRYDALNRIEKITSNIGESIAYEYDSTGNMTALIDGNENIRRFEYSPNGRVSLVQEPDGGKYIYSYDCMGELASVKQEEKVTFYERDAGGNLTAVTDAFGNRKTYTYDCYGRIECQRDSDGYETRFTYDQTGNLKGVNYGNEKSVEYEYNALRQLVKIKDWLGDTFIKPDEYGRTESVTDYKGQTIGYEYGQMGERTAVIYPEGKRVEYKYDPQMRLSEVYTGDGKVTYSYDKNGRLEKKIFPGMVQAEYGYDPAGRVTKIVNSDDRGILDELAYTYDAAGNRATMDKKRRGISQLEGRYLYTYDSCNRLAGVEKDGKRIRSYEYDVSGNRTVMERDGERSAYTYNLLNQLVSVKGSTDREYQYDKRGNLIQILENNKKKIGYQYDAANRVASFQSGKTQVKYFYNGMGQRVGAERKMAAGAEDCVVSRRDYIPDLTRGYHNMLQERREEAGSKEISVKNYLWDDGLIVLDSDSIHQYVLKDEMDTPIRLFYNNGNLIESNDYDEFGNLQYGTWNGKMPFGFTGYYKDSVTENYFAQAREYLPGEGRFASKDVFGGSLSIPESLNGFSYCLCNPLRYWDPLGYYSMAEGTDAHTVLQEDFKATYGENGKTNKRVTNNPNRASGIGYVDFYLVDNGQGYGEVYELKPDTYRNNPNNATNGVNQRQGYINALNNSYDENGNKIIIDPYGNTFNPNGKILPSKRYEGRYILYTTDPSKPGMIYWQYVDKPEEEPQLSPAPGVEWTGVLALLAVLGLVALIACLSGGMATPAFAGLFCV